MFHKYDIACIRLIGICTCILYIKYTIHLKITKKKKKYFHIDESPEGYACHSIKRLRNTSLDNQ